MTEQTEKTIPSKKKYGSIWIDLLLILIVLAGFFLRLDGLFWGDYQYLHPDERFLIWVTADIESVDSLGDYFNTATSTLNPHNRGHGFYVYGDFPVIFTRYMLEAFSENISWEAVLQYGRSLSTVFDLLSVVLIYFIGKRLFNQWVGLLAAAFSAFAVLQIQQAHFYTVDTFSTFFTTLAVYIAVLIASGTHKPQAITEEAVENTEETSDIEDPELSRNKGRWLASSTTFVLSIIFGIVVGLAAASKVNTVTVSILLPVSLLVFWLRYGKDEREGWFDLFLRDIVVGGIFAILAFRIFQPYAFSGPGFFGISINPEWMADMKEIQHLSTGDVDFPPAVQWARRGPLFAFKNLTLWGLGLPLGITAWLGFFTMGWRIFKGEWKRYLVPWLWTAVYFVWMSSLGNPMMRYQLPVYPLFALMAGWFIFDLWSRHQVRLRWSKLYQYGAAALAVLVLVTTGIWAYMFSRIYVDPMTRVEASHWIYENIPGAINLMVEQDGEIKQKVVSVPNNYLITASDSYTTNFSLDSAGTLSEIRFGRVLQVEEQLIEESTLKIVVMDTEDNFKVISQAEINSNFLLDQNLTIPAYKVQLSPAVELETDHIYQIRLTYSGIGALSIKGGALAQQTSWDEGIPVRFDGLDGYGGIYQGDLNFEVFWGDNEEKYERIVSILDQSDYILFSSNRQWGTLTRIPEKYPLTTGLYRSLIGCPDDMEVLACYNLARPGNYEGELGFELVEVFDSYPHLGSFEINDLFAEEAFSVYDHPKVMIFKKTDNYNTYQARLALSQYDYEHIVNETPGKFPDYPADLKLPEDRLAEQQAGGTWSELFNSNSLANRFPIFAVILWYLVISIFGIFIYPILRYAMPGLDDKGYPFSKFAGMLLLAIAVWLLGSAGIAVTRGLIFAVFLVFMAVGAWFAYKQWGELKREFREKRNYFILVEVIMLLLFLQFLLIRFINPDLWHQAKGGEKPMDFAYFNAVLKSTTYPPYDPWFAGGYINYYYYGFVIVGMFVKLLGIMPSIAYNLILPSLFSFVGIGAFSAVWNLISLVWPSSHQPGEETASIWEILKRKTFLGGVSAILLLLIFGNLGTVRMVWQNLQKLGSPDGVIDNINILKQISYAFQGVIDGFGGEKFFLYPGDWYWIPSRALPNGEITEFPFFTFLYSDLHAHMIALPITIFAIVWIISLLSRKWSGIWSKSGLFDLFVTLGFGAVVIGALRPTNTWDYPTYLILAAVVLMYVLLRYGEGIKLAYDAPVWWRKLLEIGAIVFVFVVLCFLLYQPFANWYGQGYTEIKRWEGAVSPFWSFFTHWGLFLFLVITWFVYETITWMAETPMSSLKKLKPYRGLIYLFITGLLAAVILAFVYEIEIGWLILPMAAWSLVLLLRKGQPDGKRLLFFMVGTSSVLLLFVEFFVLSGDIGRMNTVFKFYMQVWVMLSLASVVGMVWAFGVIKNQLKQNRMNLWLIAFVLLSFSAAIFPVQASADRFDDRISHIAPMTLNGMTYMQTAYHWDVGQEMDLNQDYKAIRWMQENVEGSPVIVEAQTIEYQWGSRYSIYTGLPTVVGWNWHQRQQRAVTPSEWVTERVDKVAEFYLTTDRYIAGEFINSYDVKYIVVGQYERLLYPGEGQQKFDELNGELWQEVYRDEETVIYEVIP